MTEQTMTLTDLKVGDTTYVINGQQNNLFAATVTARDENGVEVLLNEKQERQWYWLATGTADVDLAPDEQKIQAHLVMPDDWRVTVLNTRKRFKELHRSVIEATTSFRKDPSFQNSQNLLRASLEWTDFVAVADQHATRAENLLDYINRTL